MHLFDSEYFTYKNNYLYCGDVAVKDIIQNTGTPVYIYNKKYFLDRYNEFENAFKGVKHN